MSDESVSDNSTEDSSIVSFGLQSRDVVPVIAVVNGLISAVSGQQPTGNILADLLLPFAFGAAVVWLAQQARAQALIASAVLALFFSGLQMPAVLMGIGAIASAVFVTSWRRFDADSWAIGAAISGALTTQTVLNLPNIRFAGSASLLAAIALAPIVVTGFSKLPAEHRRLTIRGLLIAGGFALIATILAVIAALTVRNQVELGIEQAEDGVTAVEQGDQPAALALLEDAQTNFEQASDRLGGPLTWPSRFVPIAAQHSRALETAANQGSALASTAARTVTQADVDKIRGQNGEIDLALVQAVNAELDRANLTLISAQQSLTDVNTPWLLPQLSSRLDSVDEELAATATDINLASNATAVLPGILGADGQRRYIVLFVQPAESREFGGFVGAYGILEVDNGRFNLAESGSFEDDFGTAPASFASPDDFPAPYLRIGPQFNAQNLTATADLATIGAAVSELAPQWRGNPDFMVDGVITIDPYALAGMLELTGPIQVEGREEPVTSDNVVDFLLRDQYIEFDDAGRDARQDVLKVLAGQAFDELFAIEIPGPEKLGSIFGPVARSNRLSMVTVNDFENQFLERILLSADVPNVGSAVEMLGIFSQTATASKLDAYATRAVTYDVAVDPATGRVNGQLEIIDSNDAPPDASTFVLGRNPINGPDGTEVEVGDNFLAMGLYTRAEVTDFEADTAFRVSDPLPAFSYTRHELQYEVPLGGSTRVTASLSSTLEPGRYDIFIPAQATANPVTFTLTIKPASGWQILGADAGAESVWTETFTLDEPRGFTVVFEETN